MSVSLRYPSVCLSKFSYYSLTVSMSARRGWDRGHENTTINGQYSVTTRKQSFLFRSTSLLNYLMIPGRSRNRFDIFVWAVNSEWTKIVCLDELVVLFAMVDRYTLVLNWNFLELYLYIYLFFESGYILRMVSYPSN